MRVEWAHTPGAAVTMEFDAAEQIYHFAHPLLIPADDRELCIPQRNGFAENALVIP
ncbi:hypothetical protein OIE68_19485 [Nocardia vinacea]|uniref:Uncharacterized protein n=1 Tax=Nocardia vinacea TaxID=96468 RepID=A0ABZ1YXH3_9NOCA|nr:hypothetical protein OIE68_19485 [Nocardia vinacea]